jgi:membrane protease YdiL (CAAX protease family)
MQNIEKERNSWFKLAVILLAIFSIGALTAISSGEDTSLNLDDPNMILMMKLVQTVAVVFIFIAPAVAFAILWTREGLRYLGMSIKPAFSTTLIASIGMVVALPLINGLAELNQRMQLPASLHHLEEWMKRSEDTAAKMTEAFMQGTDISTLFLNLFVIAFMAAISEELFFRGMLQKVLIECFKNKHVSIWIGAILFSAFHMQFYGFIPRMFMGAYLGYLFLWTGSLWPGIIAHFMNNGLAVYVGWLINRGTISADADKVGMGPEEWIYVAFSATMVIISLILIYRIEKKRQVPTTDFYK